MVYGAPNVTYPYDILIYVNQITNDWFGRTVLMTVFLIMWFSLSYLGNKESFATSSFVVSILAILFYFIEIISGIGLVIAIIALAGSTVSLMTKRRY